MSDKFERDIESFTKATMILSVEGKIKGRFKDKCDAYMKSYWEWFDKPRKEMQELRQRVYAYYEEAGRA